MGKAFVFGDNISTDALAPGRYLRAELEVMASHCLESADPDFAAAVAPGDILVAGTNFGMGSARDQAAYSLKLLGVRAILVRSVARIFYRNAINFGLPVLLWDHKGQVTAGDTLTVDVEAGRIENLSNATVHEVEPIPERLMTLIRDGGLAPHLKAGFANGTIVPRSARQ
jgi:3-isopropylmalate/(R)-2-methylmalate dehydratase small subunit